jgi:hypothetical protein
VDADHLQLAKNIADLFAPLEQVEAVVLGGSRGSAARATDTASDVDLYVYTRADVPLEARLPIIERSGGSTRANLDLKYWGLTDVWINATTGMEIDVMYFDVAWIEDRIERVIRKHLPSLGYTTCFCDPQLGCSIKEQPLVHCSPESMQCGIPRISS